MLQLPYQVIDYSGKIITLCGSYKFKEYFDIIKADLTMKGNLVFMPEFEFADNNYFEHMSDEQIKILHEVHYAKIRKSDRVVIVAPFKYIGNDTQREIRYASSIGKPIDYITFNSYKHDQSENPFNLFNTKDVEYIPETNKMEYYNNPENVIQTIRNFF
jgi:hypothetical protein